MGGCSGALKGEARMAGVVERITSVSGICEELVVLLLWDVLLCWERDLGGSVMSGLAFRRCRFRGVS